MNSAEELLAAWNARGQSTTLNGHRVFYLDEGPRDAEVLVVLHGFPSSSLDFHRVLKTLASRFRVIVHDHLGFGFSAKPANYSYSLLEQAEVALALWKHLGVASGHLLAHDYGTSVATEILARRERGGLAFDLQSLTLANGSLLLELAQLRLAQRITRSPTLGPLFARCIPRIYFKSVVRRLWGDPRRAEALDIDAMWIGLHHDQGHLRAHQISSYLDERVRFRDRWIGALRRFDRPVHFVWGRKDPVAVAAIAERLAPEVADATITWLDDLGHYPMLEDPEQWAKAVLANYSVDTI